MRRAALLALAAAALSACAGLAREQAPPAPDTVRSEFRIFDGDEEVTADTRLRVYPSGTKESGRPVEGQRLAVSLPPAIYDVQAIRHRQGQVISVRWAERLVIMHYPDEPEQHLEVINLKPRFGALQLALPSDGAQSVDAAIFAAGEHEKEAAKPIRSNSYLLFILPGGRYDVRIRTSGRADAAAPAPTERWLLDLEVPAERTRLRKIEGE